MIRVKLLVRPHQGDEVLGVGQVYDVVKLIDVDNKRKMGEFLFSCTSERYYP